MCFGLQRTSIVLRYSSFKFVVLHCTTFGKILEGAGVFGGYLLSAYIISEKRVFLKCAKMSRVQVTKARKKLQKAKGQKISSKKPKKPSKTRLFGIGCIFDL